MKNKAGKAYASGYDARIPADILKDAGFLKEDGTLLEYNLRVWGDKIYIERSEGK